MSRFQNQSQAIAHILSQLENLKARISTVTTSGGQIRIVETSIAGGLPQHDHSNLANSGKVEYTPAVPSNWNGGVDPGNVWQALDQLVARVKLIEGLNLTVIASAANTMLFEGME